MGSVTNMRYAWDYTYTLNNICISILVHHRTIQACKKCVKKHLLPGNTLFIYFTYASSYWSFLKLTSCKYKRVRKSAQVASNMKCTHSVLWTSYLACSHFLVISKVVTVHSVAAAVQSISLDLGNMRPLNCTSDSRLSRGSTKRLIGQFNIEYTRTVKFTPHPFWDKSQPSTHLNCSSCQFGSQLQGTLRALIQT